MFDPFPFIDTILANLADAAPKLVYADALDEAGFPNRAAFVRWLGRTGRWPALIDGRLYFYRENGRWHSPFRPNTMPDVLWLPLYRKMPGMDVWFDGWVGLEKNCADVWADRTRPRISWSGRRRPSWVPDSTPIPAYSVNESALIQYHEGVR